MAEDVRVTNMSDGGSIERVAYDLADKILYFARVSNDTSYNTKDAYLDLYAECRRAAGGHRKFKSD